LTVLGKEFSDFGNSVADGAVRQADFRAYFPLRTALHQKLGNAAVSAIERPYRIVQRDYIGRAVRLVIKWAGTS
jgi:hypothetical protein